MNIDSMTTQDYQKDDERRLKAMEHQRDLVIAPPSDFEWKQYFAYADSFGHCCGQRKGFADWLLWHRKKLRIDE